MRNFQRTAGREIPVAARRLRSERGSALLIVLVFAAIVAIMLYRELPVSAFEAQRQKEDLLVSRGNEYKRAIQLFVRKVGRFPNSIDELESTNRMRFLRHRYVDPLTGKEDWRIVHAGPGGVIIDSMVKDNSSKTPNSNALGQAATFAGYNNSFTGDATANDDNEPVSAALRQRPAATKNAASGNAGASGSDAFGAVASSLGGTETNPEWTGGQTPNLTGFANAAGATQGGVLNPNEPAGFDPATGQALPSPNSAQNANLTPVPNSQQPAAQAVAVLAPGGNSISTLADQLNNVNPKTPEQAAATQTPGPQPNAGFGNTSTFGGILQNTPAGTAGIGNGAIGAAGGIAGVASKAQGKSIKVVNDQSKYKLWEFYYDLRKEQNANAGGALGGAQQNPNGTNGINGLGNNGSNSSFGQPSTFGQQQSGFGNSVPTPPSQPVSPASPAQQ